MLQAGIGDLRDGEIQNLKMRQSLQMLQARIGDLCVREVQVPELRQSFQMLQARIGDRRRSKSSRQQPLRRNSLPTGSEATLVQAGLLVERLAGLLDLIIVPDLPAKLLYLLHRRLLLSSPLHLDGNPTHPEAHHEHEKHERPQAVLEPAEFAGRRFGLGVLPYSLRSLRRTRGSRVQPWLVQKSRGTMVIQLTQVTVKSASLRNELESSG